MTDNIIKLKKSDVLTIKIQTEDGEFTGEELVFDQEDIELPLKYQELLEKDKKNREYLRNQLIIIDKREDVKGKKLLTKNEEDKIRAVNEFFNKEVEVLNIFLGKRGVQKLLNGRKLGWSTLDEIIDIIVNQIYPYLDTDMDRISKKIKEKYGETIERNNKILKDE